MEGKCEKKMWVDFQVLENSSSRRNGFALESPLTFIFIFKWGKPSKNKKPQLLQYGKKRSAKTRFLGSGIRFPIRKVLHMRYHPSRPGTRSLLVNWVCGSIWVKSQIVS